jgi:hypothetical protein
MTSVHSMLARHWSRCAARWAVCAWACALAACDTGPRLVQPVTLSAPYDRAQLWAVAPFTNESGVPVVDTFRVADAFAAEAQNVHGINALPVNRVILAMRTLEMPAVRSHVDATALLELLGADGLIVGTVTAYDPYRPMTLGLAVELYTRDGRSGGGDLDVRQLSRAARSEAVALARRGAPPAAQAAGVYHAANHQVLTWLGEYAAGRTPPTSAYGRDLYLVSMDMYTQFVSFRLIHELLATEGSRLSAAAMAREDRDGSAGAVQESRPR